MRGVDPKLIRTARDRLQFEQCRIVVTRTNLVIGHSLLPVVLYAPKFDISKPPNRRVDRPAILLNHSVNQRKIQLLYSFLQKMPRNNPMSPRGLSNDHKPRRKPVKPVRKARADDWASGGVQE